MNEDVHKQELKNFCKVCARKLTKGYKHRCSGSGTLLELLGVQISSDESRFTPRFTAIAATALPNGSRNIRGQRVAFKPTSGLHILMDARCAQ